MAKLTFDELNYQVEQLYSIPVPSNDKAIDQHCKCIADVIRNAGWTEDEYWTAFQDSVLGEDVDVVDDEECDEVVGLNGMLN